VVTHNELPPSKYARGGGPGQQGGQGAGRGQQQPQGQQPAAGGGNR
jgi:hypothetical protein